MRLNILNHIKRGVNLLLQILKELLIFTATYGDGVQTNVSDKLWFVDCIGSVIGPERNIYKVKHGLTVE